MLKTTFKPIGLSQKAMLFAPFRCTHALHFTSYQVNGLLSSLLISKDPRVWYLCSLCCTKLHLPMCKQVNRVYHTGTCSFVCSILFAG